MQRQDELLIHAPTLICGSEAASHGAVRIWAPDRRRLIACLSFWGALWCLWGAGISYLAMSNTFCILAATLVALPLFFRAPALALLRPKCIITDEHGIAVGNSSAGSSFLWDEIRAVYRVERGCGFTLVLESVDRCEINLTGFTDPVQLELFRLIVRKARLRPVARNPRLFAAPGYVPAPCVTQIAWRL
ncbi:MAG TPA: hypothetical protein VFJ58_17025 [Armatimonadota bacterium]|nr:hypothetical protein [Armatimonadota bacterium]